MDANTIRIIAGIAAVIIIVIIVWRRMRKAPK
jgi:FtsZ-interacting cell division protein ZipA